MASDQGRRDGLNGSTSFDAPKPGDPTYGVYLSGKLDGEAQRTREAKNAWDPIFNQFNTQENFTSNFPVERTGTNHGSVGGGLLFLGLVIFVWFQTHSWAAVWIAISIGTLILIGSIIHESKRGQTYSNVTHSTDQKNAKANIYVDDADRAARQETIFVRIVIVLGIIGGILYFLFFAG